jgi:Flp pilus assembly protein TadG
MILSSRVERGICSLPTLKRISRRLAKADGAEIAEAALVLPLVFMLLLGIVWFGRAFNIYSTIQQAAQQGAITAARSTCVTCGNTQSLDTTVANVVTSVMRSSSLDVTQIQATSPAPLFCTNPPGGACTEKNKITICRNVQLNPAAGIQPQQCGAVVSFQYPFQFYLPFTSLNMQPVVMSAQAQSRMEN